MKRKLVAVPCSAHKPPACGWGHPGPLGLWAWSLKWCCVLDPGKWYLQHPPLAMVNLGHLLCPSPRKLKVKAILGFARGFLSLSCFLRNQLPGLPAAAWTSSLTQEPPPPGWRHSRVRGPPESLRVMHSSHKCLFMPPVCQLQREE